MTCHAIFYLIFFFSGVIFISGKTMAQLSIRVGVMVDTDNYVGQMGLNCLSMAISDFYATHNHYKTRLVLVNRDSKGDVIGAAAAGVDLLKNVQVQAIIGPMFSTQANFLIALGDKAQVPIITFSATSPTLASLRSPYLVRATLSDSSQVQAISAIVKAYGWREVVLIYEDNEFGEGIVPYLSDALEQVNAHVPYRSIIPPLATDDQIVSELYKLMTMQTRVFIVHILASLGSRLFTKAHQLGMMSADYAWIVTDSMANELNSISPSVMESMLGVIGVRPYTPRTKELDDFKIRYKTRTQQNNPEVVNPDLNIFGLWAYDSVFALAIAAEELRNPRFHEANVSRNSTDLEAIGVSNAGPELIKALSSVTFRGLAGQFQLVNGQLQAPPYQIVNVVGPGARGVGFWTKEHGIVKTLNTIFADHAYSTSKTNFGSIIWPSDRTTPPKGWVIPTNGKKMRIGVPIKSGYTEFVHVTWNSDDLTELEGYCIDVFEAVMEALPYGVPREYIPFATPDHNMAGSYNDLTYQVYLGIYDAVVGDVTIVANRSKYIDFTLPYMESDIRMIVPIKDDKSKNAWVFVKPLTLELWLTSFCSFVFIGFLIWIFEHRINEDFRGPPWHQIGMIFWFAFSTIVFAQKERVVSNLTRFVLIVWFLVVLILTQSYTASLTTMLTVQQLQPTVNDIDILLKNKEYVGYMKGSFVHEFLINKNFDASRLLEFKSREELDELLSNKSIAAAFHEIPYIKLFLAKYCSKYMVVGPTYKADGFGFVFPIGSPLVPDVSRAILNVTEGTKMVHIEKKWLGDQNNCPESSTLASANNLGLASFWGLFLIVGIAGISALIIFVIMFLRENWYIVLRQDPESTNWSKIVELLRRFDNKDLKSHTFKNIKMQETGGYSSDHYMERAIDNHHLQTPSNFSLASPHTNCPPSPFFSTPSPPRVSFPADERSSDEKSHAMTNTQGQASQGIAHEIEPAATNENEQLTLAPPCTTH